MTRVSIRCHERRWRPAGLAKNLRYKRPNGPSAPAIAARPRPGAVPPASRKGTQRRGGLATIPVRPLDEATVFAGFTIVRCSARRDGGGLP